jgi:alginate O-acetyltransferase complex protein AlgJ
MKNNETESMASSRPAWIEWCIIFTFLGTIGIPLVLTLRTAMSDALVKKSSIPGIAKDIVKNSHRAVKDSSFGAEVAVSPCNYVLMKAFNYSPNPNMFVGDDGWMFYLRPRTGYSYYRGSDPLTNAELEEWYQFLRNRRDWCGNRGIHYLFVVAPNKSTIYGQHIPSRVTVLNDTSRFDQLLASLPDDLHQHVLDIRPALLEAAKKELVYLKADSHWNDRGAYIGYSQILQSLAKVRPGPWAELVKTKRIADEYSYEGDFAYLLKCKELCIEPRPKYSIVGGPQSKAVDFDESTFDVLRPTKEWPDFATPKAFERHDSVERPRVVVFHDSFAGNMIQFFSENFERATFLWQPNFIADDRMLNLFDAKHVDAERPDFVIEEVVERYMAFYPPPTGVESNPPKIPVEQFAVSQNVD